MNTPKDTHQRARLVAIGLSLVVGIVLMGLKFYVYWLTGSTAVLSDALESIINVIAGGFALVSIVHAAKPPDAEHPYGHGKIEYFSAGFEGALIMLAALGIFYTGVGQILAPHLLPHLDRGLLILLAASLVNLLVGLNLVRTGRRTRSLALLADGKHLLSDVYDSLGVVAGLVLVRWTGWLWLDGAVACGVGLLILHSGAKLVRQSFSGLMDASDPELLAEIAALLTRHRRDPWIDVHQLRAWRAGNRVHADFHLILPQDLSLEDAHAQVKELERIFSDHFDGLAEVLIHLDPCLPEECPVCGRKACPHRLRDTRCQGLWTQEEVTATSRIGSRLPKDSE